MLLLLLLVIADINTSGTSQCLNNDQSLTLNEKVCNSLETSDNSKFICVFNTELKNCEELVSSDCTKKFHPESSDSRRRAASEDLTEKDCENLKTSDKYNYVCVLNKNNDRCIEELILSDCTETLNYKDKNEFTQEDCNKLETSNKKYKCVPSSDKTYCVQNESISTNKFNIFLLILCLFSLF